MKEKNITHAGMATLGAITETYAALTGELHAAPPDVSKEILALLAARLHTLEENMLTVQLYHEMRFIRGLTENEVKLYYIFLEEFFTMHERHEALAFFSKTKLISILTKRIIDIKNTTGNKHWLSTHKEDISKILNSLEHKHKLIAYADHQKAMRELSSAGIEMEDLTKKRITWKDRSFQPTLEEKDITIGKRQLTERTPFVLHTMKTSSGEYVSLSYDELRRILKRHLLPMRYAPLGKDDWTEKLRKHAGPFGPVVDASGEFASEDVRRLFQNFMRKEMTTDDAREACLIYMAQLGLMPHITIKTLLESQKQGGRK